MCTVIHGSQPTGNQEMAKIFSLVVIAALLLMK